MRTGRRVLLAFLGLALVVYLVHGAGPQRVARVLWQARAFVPVILALETAQIFGDFVVLRMLLGRAVPRGAWVRSSAVAYAMMVLLPAGRAAGEVTRATLLSKHAGAGRAARASIQLQASYVFAIGALSSVELLVVVSRLGERCVLALLLAVNAVVMFTFAAGLQALLWNAHLGGRLERFLRWASRSSGAPLHVEAPPRTLPWRPALVCVATRAAEVVEYGVILRSVGGLGGAGRALVAHGIHLVAASVGDLLPNGLGIADGTYRTFAADVGFAASPERALSIAFVAHLAQLLVAAAAVVVAVAARSPRAARRPARVGAADAGAAE